MSLACVRYLRAAESAFAAACARAWMPRGRTSILLEDRLAFLQAAR